MKKGRKILAAALAVVMMLSVGIIDWKQAKANDSITEMENGIGYQKRTDMANYYVGPESDENVAPMEEGYVFGGWYTDATLKTPATSVLDEVYAKWVPDYVLSVKAQIETSAEEGLAEGERTYVRFVSSVDTKYEDYGFRVIINKRANETKFDTMYWLKNYTSEDSEGNTRTFTLYNTLRKKAGDEGFYEPTQVFGPASDYFFVAQLPNVAQKNEGLTIFVQPFWKTLDGTEVAGLAKYVRVKDSYSANRYISVPVNLASATADVAAGMVTMSCPTGYTVVDCESGIGLPSVNYYPNGTTVNIVADTSPVVDGVTSYVGNTFTDIDPTEYTYANVWFKAQEGTTAVGDINNTTGTDLTFNITAGDFCNWHEEDVTVTKRGNYKY